MEIERERVRVHLTLEEAREIARNPKQFLFLEARVDEVIDAPAPKRLSPPSHTIAKPMIAPEDECPACHFGFSPRGIDSHLSRKHRLRRVKDARGDWARDENGQYKVVRIYGKRGSKNGTKPES